jgi:drug/metabolite transporter, DME family
MTSTPTNQSIHRKGIIFVVVGAALWSIGGLGIKKVTADALTIAGFRSLFAFLVLAIALAYRVVTENRSLGPLLLRKYVWFGAFSYAFTMMSFVEANKLTTAANAILLQYSAPIFVALLSWSFLREPILRRDWLAIAGCLLGMGCFFFGKLSATGMAGNGLAILAGVGFAGLTVFLRADKFAQKDVEPAGGTPLSNLVAITLGNAIAALLCTPWMLAGGTLNRPAWATLVILGVVQIGIAYLFFTAGVSRLSALESTLLAMVEPILNPVWVALGTGEKPAPTAYLGGGIIISVLILRGWLANRSNAAALRPKLDNAA